MNLSEDAAADVLLRGLVAGACVGTGCFLRLYYGGPLAGAALLALGFVGAPLFGGAPFPCPSMDRAKAGVLALLLIGNIIGTLPPGLLYLAYPKVELTARELCLVKFQNGMILCLVKAVPCGLLLFAVDRCRRRGGRLRPTACFACSLLAATAWFLSGPEHCVLNAAYLFVGQLYAVSPLESLALLVVTGAGNLLGARLGQALLTGLEAW